MNLRQIYACAVAVLVIRLLLLAWSWVLTWLTVTHAKGTCMTTSMDPMTQHRLKLITLRIVDEYCKISDTQKPAFTVSTAKQATSSFSNTQSPEHGRTRKTCADCAMWQCMLFSCQSLHQAASSANIKAWHIAGAQGHSCSVVCRKTAHCYGCNTSNTRKWTQKVRTMPCDAILAAEYWRNVEQAESLYCHTCWCTGSLKRHSHWRRHAAAWPDDDYDDTLHTNYQPARQYKSIVGSAHRGLGCLRSSLAQKKFSNINTHAIWRLALHKTTSEQVGKSRKLLLEVSVN